MTGKKFLVYVEQCLALTLKRKDIVMIDNLPAHKAVGVREAIETRDATLHYLPKYSSDLNPIEMPFSKLKAYLRKAAERNNSAPAPQDRQIRAHPHHRIYQPLRGWSNAAAVQRRVCRCWRM